MDKKQERRKKRQEKKIKQQNSQPEKSIAAKADQLKPKRGKLPDPSVMNAIAESLYDAVNSVFEELERAGANTQTMTENAKIKGRCLYYAGAGQYVASTILGRDYRVQVGSLGVTTDKEKMFKIDAKNGGVAARRFHMWLGTDDGGFVEFADFTSRFFKEWALDSGIKWDRDDLPAFVWGKPSDIREQFGVYYEHVIEEEPDAEKQIDVSQGVIDAINDRATAIAWKRLLG